LISALYRPKADQVRQSGDGCYQTASFRSERQLAGRANAGLARDQPLSHQWDGRIPQPLMAEWSLCERPSYSRVIWPREFARTWHGGCKQRSIDYERL
jgi:hypothetical protein